MTDSTNALPIDAPDPQFAAHLEWQLRTSLRRVSRFGAPASGAATGAGLRRRLLIVAALIAGAMLFGAGGMLAAQELRRSRAAGLLAGQYRIRFEIAQLREEAAREGIAELMRANEQGLVTPQEVYEAEEKRIALAQEASVLGLDAIEVGYTGQEPDRRMSAPRVAERDLVTERLDQELTALAFRKSAAGKRVELLAKLREKGVLTADELERARLLDRVLADAIRIVEQKKALRAQFLAGAVAAARVDLLAMQAEAEANVQQAQRELDRAANLSKETGALVSAGTIPDRESRAALHELNTREAELRLATLELETIAARLGEQRDSIIDKVDRKADRR